MPKLPDIARGTGIFARAARGGIWTVLGYGGSQAARLGANLILTRLLFPEAFGLMALVSVILVGLAMFSDVGISPAISQNARGDDPDFLDTAWTMQLVRGLALWATTCALAWPVATFYGEPMLAQLLPVAGLSLLIEGFNPTRIETAKRHLLLGRVTALELISQLIGIAAMIALAWATRSVWALVAGALIGALAKLVLTHAGLPGQVNRLRWERAAAQDLIRFGKWIFLSTVFAFAANQGDRAILGHYLSMDELGIYNIGYFLASFPVLLGAALVTKLMIPLYRDGSPADSPANFARMRRMRVTLTGGLMTILLGMALFGVELIGFLYDPRYAPAGAIVVLVCCVQIPHLIGMTYSRVALSQGDSRRFFNLTATRAVLQVGLFIAGAETAGLVGALAGWGLALLLVHPLIIAIARRYGVWDPLHDSAFAAIGASVAALALWKGRDGIAALAGYAAG